jgi:hypothetical protein
MRETSFDERVTPKAGFVVGRGNAKAREELNEERTHELFDALLSGIGVLAAALEQRARPGASGVEYYARVTEALASELGMSGRKLASVVVAAQLFGLDEALRREVGSKHRPRVEAVFAAEPSAPGGLSARLRRLGRMALEMSTGGGEVGLVGAQIIQSVAHFVDLRGRSNQALAPQLIEQQLLDAGSDATLVRALVRVLERMGELGGGDESASEGEK